MANTVNAGFLKTPWWNEDKAGKFSETPAHQKARFVIGGGTVIIPKGQSQPAKVVEFKNKKGDGVLVKVVIATYNGNYESLISYGYNRQSETLAKLEKGDHVFVHGKEVLRKYKNRFGEEREISEILVHYITSDGHTSALEEMYGNQHLQAAMNGTVLDTASGEQTEDAFTEPAFSDEEWAKESDFDADGDPFSFDDSDPIEGW